MTIPTEERGAECQVFYIQLLANGKFVATLIKEPVNNTILGRVEYYPSSDCYATYTLGFSEREALGIGKKLIKRAKGEK